MENTAAVNAMNLYIIREVLCDYTPGMVVIAAVSMERCRELFLDQFDSGFDDRNESEFDAAVENGQYTVLRVVDREEGIVDYVPGGA